MNFLSDLKKFKELELNKKDLTDIIKKDLKSLTIDIPIIVENVDVIRLLEAYLSKQISLQDVVDWVNVIWFTELYEYSDSQCDSIASVLNELEEADEDIEKLSKNKIEKYLYALKNNIEFI